MFCSRRRKIKNTPWTDRTWERVTSVGYKVAKKEGGEEMTEQDGGETGTKTEDVEIGEWKKEEDGETEGMPEQGDRGAGGWRRDKEEDGKDHYRRREQGAKEGGIAQPPRGEEQKHDDAGAQGNG